MRDPDFVMAGIRKIGSPDCRLFALVRFLIVKVANTDVGRGVGGILPPALKNGIGFIEDNSRKGSRVCDDKFHVGFDIDLARRVGVGYRVWMGFDGQADASPKEENRQEALFHGG